jgi:hypothetical protein
MKEIRQSEEQREEIVEASTLKEQQEKQQACAEPGHQLKGEERPEADPFSSAPATPAPVGRRKRKARIVSEEEIMPRPSYWPFILTLALVILLIGVISHPIVLGLGAVLVIAAVIGWSLERR